MVNIRKKRVAMTKQLKREVFTACLVRVLRGILPNGSFKAVADHFEIDPKTVAKLWKSTMTQVNGYLLSLLLIFLPQLLIRNSKMQVKNHSMNLSKCYKKSKLLIQIKDGLLGHLLVLLVYQVPVLVVRLRITFAPYAQIVTNGTNLWVSTHVTTKSVAHRALRCKRANFFEEIYAQII
jgi:hypothetical protein